MYELWRFMRDMLAVRKMPRVTVDLMYRETEGNEAFYLEMVEEYYRFTQQRHRKFPLIRNDQYGVALAVLPGTFDEYFMMVEASARRNFKKAKRCGYTFDRIEHNDHMADIREIWQSTDVRQGKVPDYVAGGQVTPATHPPSKTAVHDYPYFGVFKNDKLVAYAGCAVSGELCAIEQIYGHAEHHAYGVVPMLVIGVAGYTLEHYTNVKYYTYDTLLGASVNMKRFKRKFVFQPYKVRWVLGS